MLTNYAQKFHSLDVNSSEKYGVSPYKPTLLLAVIKAVEEGQIRQNKIHITPALIDAFKHYSVKLWADRKYKPRSFVYAFYHLQGDDFWCLQEKPGKKLEPTASGSVDSLKKLSEAIDYAYVAPSLWEQLADKAGRDTLRKALLDAHFPQAAGI